MPAISLLATNLVCYFMSLPWNQLFTQQIACQPLAHLDTQFLLTGMPMWPNARGLNELKAKASLAQSSVSEFVCQSSLAASDDYYEQIIYKRKQIPTRPNSWHDLFNGLVWLQYPKTKTLLNQLHIEDIELHGLSPRTRQRNHITHFDECGVILTIECSTGEMVTELLRAHHWLEAMHEMRNAWGDTIHARMFGHANYEMLLNPFIGLTGKWLAVNVQKGFSQRSIAQQNAEIDACLPATIQNDGLFKQPKPLSPLPLLGLPGWSGLNQDPQFYHNREYFRPKRVRS
ncbi:DUF3025 domain-containing protein [Paraglaciecola polaris]|uniref:DUF3025 domain-containing protein n=1 Tax=Paraglaciecola polaris TaxID=222814 RepID=UPI0030ED3604